MKRHVPLVSKTPLGRTSFLRMDSTRERRAPKQIKSRGPKMTPIRRAARGQECTLQILGVCNGDSTTTVLCHSNRLADGKGMGLKAPDHAGCFGCSSCHDVLDGRAPRPAHLTYEGLLALFDYARERTHAILRAKGLME
jgi:hypothetical protein